MNRSQLNNKGFGLVGLFAAIVVIAAAAGIGAYLYHRHSDNNKKAASTSSNTKSSSSTNQQGSASTSIDPYAGWKTFTDTGSATASGINIKYPSDWQVNTTSTKTYAWSIGQTSNPNNVITVINIFNTGTQTARQEWSSCDGTDACGGAPDDKVLSGSESTINGLNAYTATVQNSSGTYHVTVIRGNKAAQDGVPYIQFTTYTTDQAALSTFSKIMTSANFPS